MPTHRLAVAAAGLLVAVAGSAGCAHKPARQAATRTAPSSTTASTVAATTTELAATTTTATLPGGAGLPPGAHAAVDPATPSAAAGAIDAANAVIADRAAGEAALDAAASNEQAALHAIVVHPEWRDTVVRSVRPEARAMVEANVTAGLELRTMTAARPSLPAWRIVRPPPAEELLRDYRAAEAETGVPWSYLAAVNLVESRMGRIRGTSTAGAQGPMQFLPSTWARYGNGGDINDYREAIAAAARLLRADGGASDMQRALFSYNHSQHYVRAVTLYAQQMQASERAYFAYYHWRVYYRYVLGDVVLEEGYSA